MKKNARVDCENKGNEWRPARFRREGTVPFLPCRKDMGYKLDHGIPACSVAKNNIRFKLLHVLRLKPLKNMWCFCRQSLNVILGFSRPGQRRQ